jgi:hypothetical protein
MNEQDEKALAALTPSVAQVIQPEGWRAVKTTCGVIREAKVAMHGDEPMAVALIDHADLVEARAHLSSVVAERDDERNRANKLGIELGVVRGRLEDAEFRAERAEAELARVRQAMAVAVRHIEMADLRISHKKDAALIDFSLAPKESNDGNG